MAIMTDVGAIDSFHFESGEFDELLTEHGTPALMRYAMRCGCWTVETGQADPACMTCRPYGYVWDAAIAMNVFGPNRRPTRRPDAVGTFDVGDAFFSLPTGQTPPHYSRFTLPTLSEIIVDDILTKGREDTIRFGTVSSVIQAHYSVRTPPTGYPYTRANTPLVLGTDISVAGRDVTWLNGAIADGTRYTIQFKAHQEWVVWEPQDRNEGGKPMPFRYLCKRLDFLAHPKATGEMDYAAP